MTQELIDLRTSILEGRYDDALAIVDDLEGMSKKATLRGIKSYLVRMLIHLIKNQVEQRLTNSWAASIRGSVREIQDLNLKENKTSYYVNADEWNSLIDDEFEEAIATASVEVREGAYTPFQLAEIVEREEIRQRTRELLALTYAHPANALTGIINEYLTHLPGGEDWKEGRSK